MGQPAYMCFYWQGGRSTLSSTEARCDRTSDLPPASVRDWPNKPHHLCKAIYGDRINALSWMWTQMGTVARHMQQHFPEHVPDVSRQYQSAAQNLDHGDLACEWRVEFPNRTCVFVAIVAVWDDGKPLQLTNRKGNTMRPPDGTPRRTRRTDTAK